MHEILDLIPTSQFKKRRKKKEKEKERKEREEKRKEGRKEGRKGRLLILSHCRTSSKG
jgi:hypothetical protein